MSLEFKRSLLLMEHMRMREFGCQITKETFLLDQPISFSTTHPRVKVWLWRALRNKLPTKENLILKGIHIESWCSFCINQ